jgi:hypothetical protein
LLPNLEKKFFRFEQTSKLTLRDRAEQSNEEPTFDIKDSDIGLKRVN